MNKSEIALIRLYNQHVALPKLTKPAELVSWLGAVQAQDYGMAKWAVAARLTQFTETAVEAAINQGEIIRTHILRPTWHLVAAQDIYWLLHLTAPQIKKACAFMNRKLELNEPVFSGANYLLEQALMGGQQLTRQELVAALQAGGIQTDNMRAAHIILNAELEGILCNGARQGNKQTYALLRERVPTSNPAIDRTEALAKLATRYFTSHGPATVADFAWWSGLTLTDAKKAIDLIKTEFIYEKIAAETYWFKDTFSTANANPVAIHLLPAFDEFLVSYKDRSASLAPATTSDIITNNGIFKPIILVGGQVVGHWQVSKQKAGVHLYLRLFNPALELDEQKLAGVIKKYKSYLNAVTISYSII